MINFLKNILITKFLSFKYKVKIVGPNVRLNLNDEFEGANVIHAGSDVFNSSLGFASYIGPNCEIFNTKIGKYSCIGHDVKTVLGAHPSHTFVSVHPCFYSARKQSGFSFVDKQVFNEYTKIGSSKYSIIIGNDVWIGAGVKIVQGVTINDGAIIGTGSVIAKDVPPYTICAGNPQTEIRKRFSQNTIERLMQIKWWEKDTDFLKARNDLFQDIEKFMDGFTE